MVGILFLLSSLPVGWFTIAHPQVAGGQVPAFLLPTGPVTVTGLTGRLGFFGIQLPIWLVIALGIRYLLGWLSQLFCRHIISIDAIEYGGAKRRNRKGAKRIVGAK